MLWSKKNSYKEFDNEKKFLRRENSLPPPITFLMVRPLESLIFYHVNPRVRVINVLTFEQPESRPRYLTLVITNTLYQRGTIHF